jgi:VCBS repeat-containing protein
VAVAPALTLADLEGDAITGATVTLATGARDNLFGTAFETLSLSDRGSDLLAAAGLSVSVTASAGGATLVVTGTASLADYQAVLREVLYDNTNPNAFAGPRTVTISVTDVPGQASNAASFATTTPTVGVAVGQRIFIDGVDSGRLVAQVLDGSHFVASGPLAGLEAGDTLGFGAVTALTDTAEGLVATTTPAITATAAGPVVATVTVHVPWTPVIDVNGEAAGRDRTIAYVEGQAPVAIATSDASITDQGGLIRTLTVELLNPRDNFGGAVRESLLAPDEAVSTGLSARGITAAGNGTGANGLTGATRIVFTASGTGSDATNFQIALRGVKYQNVSQDPDGTQRQVRVSSVDVDGNTGVDATTYIGVTGVNDAPHGVASNVEAIEDTTRTLRVADFGFTDPVDAADGTADVFTGVVISRLPAAGTLLLDGVPLAANDFVSVTDIAAGRLTYVPVADAAGTTARTTFEFRVQDGGGTANGGVDLDPVAATMTIDVAGVNDAPVLVDGAPALATIREDERNNAGTLVSDLVGTGGTRTGIVDADGAQADGAESIGRGIAIHELAHGAPGSGTWEYNLNVGAGAWVAVGAVSTTNALLLPATASLRFVPDGANATTGTVGFYLWDGASGAAGGRADVTDGHRGGTTAFSLLSDTASLVVSPVNDAPTIDLNGAEAGLDSSVVFSPRGDAVRLFDDRLAIADPDAGDLIGMAVVILDASDALDNSFGTRFESLSTTQETGAYAGSQGSITISVQLDGNRVVLRGAGTAADYVAALRTLVYQNGNPNAYAGPRPVTVQVYDEAETTAGVGKFASAIARLTVEVNWGAVADLNGDTLAGRNHQVTYVENAPGLAIAAADASLVDQDGNIASVTAELTNHPDGGAERLFVSGADVTILGLLGIGVVGNGTHAVQLTGNADGTFFQLGLRAIRYVNDSEAPDTAQRVVLVTSVDMSGNPGVGATTTIGITAVNDAPTGEVTVTNADAANGTAAPKQNDMLSAAHTLADVDGMTGVEVRYQWQRAGADIAGATGSSYTLTQADVGKSVRVVASYTDGSGFANTVASAATGAVVNVNDAPVLGPVAAGSVAEVTLSSEVTASALSGTLEASDLDGDALTFGITGGTVDVAAGTVTLVGAYGKLTVNRATGAYVYARNTAAIDAVPDGATRTDAFTVTVTDGTLASEQAFTVTITGANDAPTVTAGAAIVTVVEAGGVANATAGTPGATVTLTLGDVDDTAGIDGAWLLANGWSTAEAGATYTKAGTYGTATLTVATGVVGYALDDTKAATQALKAGQAVTDDFVVRVTDGAATAQATASFAITGANDAPTVTAQRPLGGVRWSSRDIRPTEPPLRERLRRPERSR